MRFQHSEKELSQGFSDLVMVPMTIQYPAIKYSYLVEVKYIKPADYEKEAAAVGRLSSPPGSASWQINGLFS